MSDTRPANFSSVWADLRGVSFKQHYIDAGGIRTRCIESGDPSLRRRAAELRKARLRAGLSQAELAARMSTSQSTIARLESGQTLPSTKTLLRYAEATGSKFHVRLSAA